MQTCLPQKSSVSTSYSLCPYFQIFDWIFFFFFFFFADAPQISWKRKLSKENIFIIYLVRKVCELTFSFIQIHYKTGTLSCSDAFILSISAQVVLDQRMQNTFSKSNARCVLLSLMPTGLSWMAVVWSELVSLVPCILSPLCQFRTATCHWQLRIQTCPIWRWLTSVKLRMQRWCSWVKKNCFDQSGLKVYFSTANGLKWCPCHMEISTNYPITP